MTHDGSLDACNCCEGLEHLTPQDQTNPPGATALAYRVGTHASFKASMLASLSGVPGSEIERIEALSTRADDDPTIALFDAAATMLDVLTFYQERIANEGYLRTATERLSVLELARAIGYELKPGVAAAGHLAFEMESPPAPPAATNPPPATPGVPESALIPIGTRVQSIPGQDEKPQTFETVEAMTARRSWNRLRPRLTQMVLPANGHQTLYLAGTATNLRKGDMLLIVGEARIVNPASEQWDMARVIAVQPVTPEVGAPYTVLSLAQPLSFGGPAPAQPQVFVLRQRAALFGHNAPAWRSMPFTFRADYLNLNPVTQESQVRAQTEWPDFTVQGVAGVTGTTLLDTTYDGFLQGGWVVLAAGATKEAYRIIGVTEQARALFALTGKGSRLTLEGENLVSSFNTLLRETVVFGQSEALTLAPQPVTSPVFGDEFSLEGLYPELTAPRTLILNGKRVRVRVSTPLTLLGSDGITTATAAAGDSLLVEQITRVKGANSPYDDQIVFVFIDKNGFTGTVQWPYASFTAAPWVTTPAEPADAFVSEVIEIKEVIEGSDPTRIKLTASLLRPYDRPTTFLYGNVARATHGETRREVLGSGDGSAQFQRFVLKQAPLTYVSATNAAGAETTLQVRVNDVLWHEADSLYAADHRSRAYTSRRADDGKVTVMFGDGANGARLPTGNENVTAVYRTGIGTPGLLKAGQLSLLMTRPLGVKSVTNPLPTAGAADPESRDDARENAPFTVLTLDRIVSLRDFEDFGRAFAGIGKTQATHLWDGEARVLHLTVAAAAPNSGSAGDYTIDPKSDLFKNLRLAMDAARDTMQRLEVDTYAPRYFRVQARVLVAPDYLPEKVQAAVSAALLDTYAFERRSFGQPVFASEVVGVMQGVEGVTAAFLTALHLRGSAVTRESRLTAARALPVAGPGGVLLDIQKAQLLLIDPVGIDITAEVEA